MPSIKKSLTKLDKVEAATEKKALKQELAAEAVKAAQEATATKPPAKPSTKLEPKPLTWKDMSVFKHDTVEVPGGGYLRLSGDLARKRAFFKVVGGKILVIKQLRFNPSPLRLRGVPPPLRHYRIGKVNLEKLRTSFTPTTTVADILGVFYPKDVYRAATSEEIAIYRQYIVERDDAIASYADKRRQRKLAMACADLEHTKKAMIRLEAEIKKLSLPVTKTVNKTA